MTSAPRSKDRFTHETTDLKNAERLVALHGSKLRYVHAWSRWVAWDGMRWQADATGAALRFAADTTRAMLAEDLAKLQDAQAKLAEASDEATKSDARKKIAKAQRLFSWSVKSQNAARLHAMLDVARADDRIAVRHDALDSDPWLFNVKNGTIDLRTGRLRSHSPKDLLTKLAPVAFDFRATCPTWDAFLDRAMAGNAELVGFLRRMIGYSLTGSTREHVLAFFFGGGANGKSTFLTTLHAMMGDYATPAPRGLLFRSRGDRHPTELASLHGARFVTCSEIEEGQAFDESLVKDLTGGDPIECRRMREDFWTFVPTHKLICAGNHKPAVRGDDEGIWRRMRLIPWTVTIPKEERDKRLPEKLHEELPGILAWAVRGCLEWQRDGLGEPPIVIEATSEYRDESDVLGEFFRLHLAFDANATIAKRTLREEYETFCRDTGHTLVGAKRFVARLRARGVTETTVRAGPVSVLHGWRGVRLMTDAEKTAAVAWSGRSDVALSSARNPVYSDREIDVSMGEPKTDATSSYVATAGDRPPR